MSDTTTQDRTTPAAPAPDALKLAAFDVDDLAIVSAHLQDALVKVGDMAYLPAEKRFACVVARFDWPALLAGICERRSTGLHFERVLSVQQTGVPQHHADRPVELNLLSITFEPSDAPAGVVLLIFSGGAAIRLSVECLELGMSDLGPRWLVNCRPPGHPLEAEAEASA